MGRRKVGHRAWLVRWEWAGEHAAVEKPIIALFHPNTGAEKIRDFAERYYMATKYEPSELLHYLRHPDENPYRARFGDTSVVDESGRTSRVMFSGEILCGHN